MTKPAVVNIDMDFFSKPVFNGNFYISEEYLSPNSYKSKSKVWIQPCSIINDLLFDGKKVRGASFNNDSQILSTLERIKSSDIIEEPYSFINIDAHLDIYPFTSSLEQYESKPFSEYSDHDYLIHVFNKKLCQEVIWVMPNLTDEEIKEQFKPLKGLNYHYDERAKLLKIEHSTFSIRVQCVNWSEFMTQNYDIKFLTLTLNKHMSKANSDMIETIHKRIKDY